MHAWLLYYDLACNFSIIAMSEMRESTEHLRSVVIEKTKICNYGQARYKIENALNNVNGYDLTEEFKSAVRLLPLSYSVNTYERFLDDWGTVSEAKLVASIYNLCVIILFYTCMQHIIVTVSVGTRELNRTRATYMQVYDYLSREVGAAY